MAITINDMSDSLFALLDELDNCYVCGSITDNDYSVINAIITERLNDISSAFKD